MKARMMDMSQFSHTWLDIPYAQQSPSQKLDLILPENGDAPFPLILFIHGGGWVADDKRAEPTASIFKAVSQGYALAAINYRLAQEARWPAQLYDAKSALRFLRANRDRFHINTDRVVVWGNSAGGHISNMLAATGGRGILEDYSTGNESESSRVDGLIAWYAPSDIYRLSLECNMKPEDFIGELDLDSPTDYAYPQNILMGFPVLDNETACISASPLAFVSAAFPAALYQHGTADVVVPYTQSVAMYNKIRYFCGDDRVQLDLFPQAVHGDQQIKSDTNIARCMDFIDTIVFGKPQPRTPLPQIRLMP